MMFLFRTTSEMTQKIARAFCFRLLSCSQTKRTDLWRRHIMLLSLSKMMDTFKIPVGFFLETRPFAVHVELECPYGHYETWLKIWNKLARYSPYFKIWLNYDRNMYCILPLARVCTDHLMRFLL